MGGRGERWTSHDIRVVIGNLNMHNGQRWHTLQAFGPARQPRLSTYPITSSRHEGARACSSGNVRLCFLLHLMTSSAAHMAREIGQLVLFAAAMIVPSSTAALWWWFRDGRSALARQQLAVLRAHRDLLPTNMADTGKSVAEAVAGGKRRMSARRLQWWSRLSPATRAASAGRTDLSAQSHRLDDVRVRTHHVGGHR
jgi:hypothetical protein